MTAPSDPRLRLAHKVLGDVHVIDEPQLPRRLLHVVDARGRHHIVKQHHDATRFGHETRAYATYLAGMRDITACLVAQDAGSRTLLLSYLPGRDCDTPGIAPKQRSMVHYRAGAALRRLHDRVVTADLLTCAVEPVLLDADVVFHLAGMPGVRQSWGTSFNAYVQSNILTAQRVMDAATRLGVPRVVVASSSSVYGPTAGRPSLESDHPHPASPYAVTKLAEEQLCLAHAARPDCRTSVIALRYFTVYGPRQRTDMFIYRALHSALTGTPLRVYGDGRQRRDFTFIDDAVTATLAAATAPDDTGVVNVGGGTNASLLDVIQVAERLTGRTVSVEYFTTRNGDVPATQADGARARTHLGWQPTVDLASGMRAQAQYLVGQATRQAA